MSLPVAVGVDWWRFENDVDVRDQQGEAYQALPHSTLTPSAGPGQIIVLVAHQKSAGYINSTGAHVPAFDIVGGGNLYVLHGGELVEGTWFLASQVED